MTHGDREERSEASAAPRLTASARTRGWIYPGDRVAGDTRRLEVPRVVAVLRRWTIPVLAALFAFLIVQAGLDPDGYFRYGHEPPPISPPSPVLPLGFAAITLVEAAILSAILRPWKRGWTWRRAAMGLLVFAPWTLVNSTFLIHAPVFILLRAAWLWIVSFSALLALVVSLVVEEVRRSADR